MSMRLRVRGAGEKAWSCIDTNKISNEVMSDSFLTRWQAWFVATDNDPQWWINAICLA